MVYINELYWFRTIVIDDCHGAKEAILVKDKNMAESTRIQWILLVSYRPRLSLSLHNEKPQSAALSCSPTVYVGQGKAFIVTEKSSLVSLSWTGQQAFRDVSWEEKAAICNGWMDGWMDHFHFTSLHRALWVCGDCVLGKWRACFFALCYMSGILHALLMWGIRGCDCSVPHREKCR